MPSNTDTNPKDKPVQSLEGNPDAAEMIPLLYDRLRNLAARYMRRERASHSLEPAALVNEAYLRLVKINRMHWNGKTHFYAVAATQMRRVLVDHARRVAARKRGLKAMGLSFGAEVGVPARRTLSILELDEALDGVARRNLRRGRVAELRLFGGMTIDEVAQVTGLTPRTVKDDWRVARTELARHLSLRPTRPI